MPIWEFTRELLGLDRPAGALTYEHMIMRALVIYLAGVVMVRLSSKRFVGRRTPFDLVLGIVLGAVLARAINGSAPFFPTLSAAFLLVLLDRAFAVAAFRWDGFERLVVGIPFRLVHDGRPDSEAQAACHCDDEDLRSAFRRNANVAALDDVREAWLEPDGEISVVPRRPEPRVVDVPVEEGVRTVRIEFA